MNIGRQDIRHHSDEDVRRYLEKALELVAELELHDELRPIAFTKAIDLLAAKQLILEQYAGGVTLPGRIN